MCLTTITNRNTKSTGVGFKVFIEDSRGLMSEWCGNDRPKPIRKWIHEIDSRLGTRAEKIYTETSLSSLSLLSPLNSYPKGFHIYKSLKDVLCFPPNVIKKVRYRGAVVEGTQAPGCKVVVAKEIFILKRTITK